MLEKGYHNFEKKERLSQQRLTLKYEIFIIGFNKTFGGIIMNSKKILIPMAILFGGAIMVGCANKEETKLNKSLLKCITIHPCKVI